MTGESNTENRAASTGDFREFSPHPYQSLNSDGKNNSRSL